MDSVLETIEMSVAAVIFCLAVYFFMMLNKNTAQLTDEVLKLQETAYCFSSDYSEQG